MTSLYCALCLLTRNDVVADEAVTTINGTAVCFDHVGDIARNVAALRTALRERQQR